MAPVQLVMMMCTIRIAKPAVVPIGRCWRGQLLQICSLNLLANKFTQTLSQTCRYFPCHIYYSSYCHTVQELML